MDWMQLASCKHSLSQPCSLWTLAAQLHCGTAPSGTIPLPAKLPYGSHMYTGVTQGASGGADGRPESSGRSGGDEPGSTSSAGAGRSAGQGAAAGALAGVSGAAVRPGRTPARARLLALTVSIACKLSAPVPTAHA